MIYIQFSRFLEKRRFTPKGFDPYIIILHIRGKSVFDFLLTAETLESAASLFSTELSNQCSFRILFPVDSRNQLFCVRSQFIKPLSQFKSVFLELQQTCITHFTQLIRHCAPVYRQVVCKLLAVKRDSNI